jgi:phage terminase large subunit GpA-like protein
MTDKRSDRFKNEMHCPECGQWHTVRIDWGACVQTRRDPRVLVIRYECRACGCLFECEHTRSGDVWVTDSGDYDDGEPLTAEQEKAEIDLAIWKERHDASTRRSFPQVSRDEPHRTQVRVADLFAGHEEELSKWRNTCEAIARREWAARQKKETH